MSVHTGQLIAGRYRLDSWVGAGSMGEVWRATDLELGRTVAVKYIRRRDGDDGRADRMMMREARIVASLLHPNIVTLFDTEADGYLIMEYLPSADLAATVKRRGPLTPRQVAGIGSQLAAALGAVHAAGIVHGDVKPTNTLVAAEIVKLTDFGIARMMPGEHTLNDSGRFIGTPSFIAPEVAVGQDPTPASDVFSLGATLYAAVEGESPYGETDNMYVALHRAANWEIQPCRQAGPLAPVIELMLSRDPAARPDAARVRKLLDGIAAGVPVDPEPPAPSGEPGSTSHRRRLVGAASMLACAVLAAVLVMILHRHAKAQTRPPVAVVAPATIGNARTADPCALISTGPLAGFGRPTTDPHYGDFNRCDVRVDLAHGVSADVEVLFLNPGTVPAAAWSPIGTVGSLMVARKAEQGGECDRILSLPDHYQVVVSADRSDGKGTGTCDMADVATDSAVTALDRGQVGRRVLPAASLARLDACELLGPTALKRSVGVLAGSPSAGFGAWTCRWGDDVTLEFDQDTSNDPLNGSARKLGGYNVSIQAQGEGHGTCEAIVEYRSYSGANGATVHELVDLTVTGHRPVSALCGSTRKLAAAAAAALPRV